MALIIGIGGVSMAGKSTLACTIKSWYPDKKVRILCQDDFVLPEKDIPKINDKTDWERPESIDFDEFIAYILARSTDHDIVIAEGLFAYADTTLNSLYNKKIFLEITEETFQKRKTDDTRWGPEPDWYIDHVWTSYLKYGKLSLSLKDVFIIKNDVSSHLENIEAYLSK